MATGLAVMGFGGGAMIGGPMFVKLMKLYPVWQVWIIIGFIDLIAMLIGAFTYRVPPPGWKPAGNYYYYCYYYYCYCYYYYYYYYYYYCHYYCYHYFYGY